MLAALLAASALVLPASPRAVAVGDVDGDGTAEIALLLVYPRWGSESEFNQVEGAMEVTVVPAIQDRRELHVYDVGKDGALEPAANPLTIGREVLALGGDGALGPVLALTDAGPARVVVEADATGARSIAVRRFAELPTVLAGADAVFADAVIARDVDGDGSPEAIVPTARGLTPVRLDGTLLPVIEALDRGVRSGAVASLEFALPDLRDVDRDGTLDLLAYDARRERARWQRGRGAAFAAPVEWDLEKPLAARYRKDSDSADKPWLAGVLDMDRDGTLEAAVATFEDTGDGVGGFLRTLRALPASLAFYELSAGGTVAAEPERTLKSEGIFWVGGLPEDAVGPFADLDGDGVAELVTLTLRIGVVGLARAAASGVARAEVTPRVYRLGAKGYEPVANAVAPFDFRFDLNDEELTRFASIPGDLDGDGRADFVIVDKTRVLIHRGLEGARFEDSPSITLSLAKPLRSWFGAVFRDVDGDGALDLVAFEALKPEGDDPSSPAQIEVLFPRRARR